MAGCTSSDNDGRLVMDLSLVICGGGPNGEVSPKILPTTVLQMIIIDRDLLGRISINEMK